MIEINRSFSAFIDKLNEITILLPYNYQNGESNTFLLDNGNEKIILNIKEKFQLHDFCKYVCVTEEPLYLAQTYWIEDEHGGRTDLQIGAVIRTNEFDETFYYDGPLGCQYDKKQTTFTLWAPTAVKAKVKLYDVNNEEWRQHEMERHEKGVWSITLREDLENIRYTFLVCINLVWNEAVDPYVTAVTQNGELGVVIDASKTIVVKEFPPKLDVYTDSIIYEAHIRDLTIHESSGVKEKATYNGFAESGTKTANGYPTGLDYIKDLGVTHVELLPINDFCEVDEREPLKSYNWGYNPLHFNVPEGSYASDSTDPYARIIELKRMIQKLHQHGLRVVMDVVYNHVFIRETSSFEKLVPGYYFRHDLHGMPSNGTGVGNDIASERRMVRKFIIDSIQYWLQEYDVDGFRFDLMGILDIDTMLEVREVVDRLKENVLLIGEGWDLNTPLSQEKKATIRNARKMGKVGHFNDWFRDSIKGSTFNLHDKGYALGSHHYRESAKQLLAGSIGLEKREKGLFDDPYQSVNYVESHDNHTLWDKINRSLHEEVSVMKRRHRLATAMGIIAQGIPFIHSGQEFFRTKQGIENSYKSPDHINEIDWLRMEENISNVEFVKGLIQIRKAHGAFRFSSANLIRTHMSFLPLEENTLAFTLKNVGAFGKWNNIFVIVHPDEHEVVIPLFGNWDVIVDGEKAQLTSLRTVTKQLEVKPISFYVLVQS